MKNALLWILLALATATQAGALEQPAPPALAPLPQQAQAAHLTAQILARYHYKPTPLDNALSEKIFDRYLKALDPDKLFFVQADIDRYTNVRATLGDAIVHDDLRIPFDIFNLYERRVAERFAFARELLKQNFDFDRNESYQYERDKEPWPKSEEELRDLWRKRVKNDWLRIKLAGTEEKAIRVTLDKRYSNSLTRENKSKSEDVFQTFMDAYTTTVEPHTDYFGPRASEEFDIEMKLSLVGVGATLQQRDEYMTIRELVPGGPAARSAMLNVGDRIVGVGQGNNGAVIDVVGWRIDDVVNLVRGTKGTVVRLEVLPANVGPEGQHKLVPIVRNKISFEQLAAKKSVIQVKDGTVTRKVGVISLPTFYQDFDARSKGEKEFKSATRDVARLLDQLKRDKVDGVLVDLRDNGGGSLDEAIGLTGLFTGKGPVVQERDAQGKVRVENADNPKLAWTGPLGVLINRGSASASEIFAAAIQDYGRGIIIGESSFGKGTVQTMVDLDQIAHNEKPKFGELKMTVAQFFRVNGGTTQLRGVTPDISFPTISDPDSFGESSFDNALPWTTIKAAKYTPAGDLADLLPPLRSSHALRIAEDKDFQYLLEDLAEFKSQRTKHVISLNEVERRKDRDMREARLRLRMGSTKADENGKHMRVPTEETAAANITAQQDNGLESDEGNLNDALAAEKGLRDVKDVWLHEAAHVLCDEVNLLRTNAKLAVRATRKSAAIGVVQNWESL